MASLQFWAAGLCFDRYLYFSQPVHNNGSSGYGSLGSNGSHEHYISVESSSDSNGNLWEDSHREPVRLNVHVKSHMNAGLTGPYDGSFIFQMTLQQFCADVNKVKNWGQQAYLDSRRKLTPLGPATAGLEHDFSASVFSHLINTSWSNHIWMVCSHQALILTLVRVWEFDII